MYLETAVYGGDVDANAYIRRPGMRDTWSGAGYYAGSRHPTPTR